MSDTLVLVLTLISGISWTIVYLDLINRGFRDKTCGMPLFALAFNIAWEFIFGFLAGDGFSIQRIVNVTWFTLDAIIVVTYFRYGRREYPASAQRWFTPWSVAAFVAAFAIIFAANLEFPDFWGARYSAFAQNLLMSVLFIFKWLGTLAPTILIYGQTGSNLILVLGVAIFVYDVIYIAMLHRQFAALGLNPFTRRPVDAAAKYQPIGI